MVEQWISAITAAKVAENSQALLSRLRDGLIAARAERFVVEGEPTKSRAIPANFWTDDRYNDLTQDWESGDFASDAFEGDLEARAYGVTFGLAGILNLRPAEERALLARSLSVAGNPDWLSAKVARNLAFTEYHATGLGAGTEIIAQARLGFIASRAVLAQGSVAGRDEYDWSWQEREWDIEPWFWTNFTSPNQSAQVWETGMFSGRGIGPHGIRWITLSGVHFYRPSLASLGPAKEAALLTDPIRRGRKQEYDWDAATTAIWGQIFRAELIPDNQAQVEKAFQRHLEKADKEPSESTVRPYASRLWKEFKK
ncbi:hypothetical protein [Novosphingobium lentum]|uniref:hypothetical protein n=1 Tax=Novosphingobium lentum TaxID=145287 RepID=UPI000B0CECE6|nr:hypothetical protein [Novosphingobium lentum]